MKGGNSVGNIFLGSDGWMWTVRQRLPGLQRREERAGHGRDDSKSEEDTTVAAHEEFPGRLPQPQLSRAERRRSRSAPRPRRWCISPISATAWAARSTGTTPRRASSTTARPIEAAHARLSQVHTSSEEQNDARIDRRRWIAGIAQSAAAWGAAGLLRAVDYDKPAPGSEKLTAEQTNGLMLFRWNNRAIAAYRAHGLAEIPVLLSARRSGDRACRYWPNRRCRIRTIEACGSDASR